MEVVHNYYFFEWESYKSQVLLSVVKSLKLFGESNYIKYFHLEAKTAPSPSRIKEVGHNLTVNTGL